MKFKKNIIKQILILVLSIFLLIFINLLINKNFVRIDLTEDGIHSLTPQTINFLENKIDDVISIDVFLEGEYTAEIEKLKIGLHEKLEEFKIYAGNKIKIRYVNLDEDPELADEEKKQLVEKGLYPVNILSFKKNKKEVHEIWPGMILRQGSNEVSVRLIRSFDPRIFPVTNINLNIKRKDNKNLTNDFIDQIEFHLMEGLMNLINPDSKRITFLRGHGELDDFELPLISYDLKKLYSVDTTRIVKVRNDKWMEARDYGIYKADSVYASGNNVFILNGEEASLFDENNDTLKNIYNAIFSQYGNEKLDEYKLDPSNYSENLQTLSKTDLLIIAKPREPFTSKEIYIIDQFIMNGGIVVWLIDLINFDEQLLQNNSIASADFFKISDDENLKNMLFKYGARVNKDIITDVNCAPINRIDGGGKLNNWFFYPLVSKSNALLTNNVAPIKMRFASSVDPVGNDNIKKTVILESSSNYRKLSMVQLNRISYDFQTAFNPSNFNEPSLKSNMTLGVLLEGEFSSFFSEGNQVAQEFKKIIDDPELKFKDKSPMNKMVVIGDGDLIKNEWARNLSFDPNKPKEKAPYIPVPLEFEKTDYEKDNLNKIPVYGNGVFFLNLIDHLLDNDELIELRSRMSIPRVLDQDFISNNDNRNYIMYLNMIIPVLIVILLGILIWLYRINKYGRNGLN